MELGSLATAVETPQELVPETASPDAVRDHHLVVVAVRRQTATGSASEALGLAGNVRRILLAVPDWDSATVEAASVAEVVR